MTDTKKIEEAIEILKGVLGKDHVPHVVTLTTSANHWAVNLTIQEDGDQIQVLVKERAPLTCTYFNLDKTDCLRLVYILGFFAERGRLPRESELEG
jgi:hypothetical protein